MVRNCEVAPLLRNWSANMNNERATARVAHKELVWTPYHFRWADRPAVRLHSIEQLGEILSKVTERAETSTAIVKSTPLERRLPPLG